MTTTFWWSFYTRKRPPVYNDDITSDDVTSDDVTSDDIISYDVTSDDVTSDDYCVYYCFRMGRLQQYYKYSVWYGYTLESYKVTHLLKDSHDNDSNR